MQKLHKPKDWRWLLHRALSIIFSRTVVTVVLVLAQAVWLFSVFYWLSDYSHPLPYGAGAQCADVPGTCAPGLDRAGI